MNLNMFIELRVLCICNLICGNCSASALLVSVGALDGRSGSLLGTDLIGCELSPELLELLGVAVDVEWVVHNVEVLLVAAASLEGPVE